MIKLGSKVKCKISGFIGIAVARTEFINGCIQYSVAGKVKKDGNLPEEIGIDEGSLEVIKKLKSKIKKKETGGANTRGIFMKGY